MNGKIALWLKTPEGSRRELREHSVAVALRDCPEAREVTKLAPVTLTTGTTPLGEVIPLVRVPVNNLSAYEQIVTDLEQRTRFRVDMFDANIAPELQYLIAHDLRPLTRVQERGEHFTTINASDAPALSELSLRVIPSDDIRRSHAHPIKAITIAGKLLVGDEKRMLRTFVKLFIAADPDIICMEHAFSRLPYLARRLREHSLVCPFHRWDETAITYRGGKSYFSYGSVRYQDHSVRLHGRLLIDASTVVGEAGLAPLVELTQLSGVMPQHVASRSYGAAFQAALVRTIISRGFLVPYKQKPLERPLSMLELLNADRAGHTFDAKIGFHTDVAAIDFCSMYPHLITTCNISAETIIPERSGKVLAPGTTIGIAAGVDGLVPQAIKPFLERRMYYKANPSAINKEKAAGLKWVLVTSYGYLRFREFKLGVPSSHMAIGAYAREILVAGAEHARANGFTVLHGIIDALYLQKPGVTDVEIAELCREIEDATQIPIVSDGIFRWVVFLPSVRDSAKPVPTRYYGAFRSGEVKARGILLRMRSTPRVVAQFQQQCLDAMATCLTREAIAKLIPGFAAKARALIAALGTMPAETIACRLKLSKIYYDRAGAQRSIVAGTRASGLEPLPGQSFKYVWTERGVVLADEYTVGKTRIDTERYMRLFVKALSELAYAGNVSVRDVRRLIAGQTTLTEYVKRVRVVVHRRPARVTGEERGLSERVVRRALVRAGWRVWRGGMIGAKIKADRPAVVAAYEELSYVLDTVYPGILPELITLAQDAHGMPDYVCCRQLPSGKQDIVFVECKRGREQLSARQRATINRLHELGCRVEVHVIDDGEVRYRVGERALVEGSRTIALETQQRLKVSV